MAKETSLISEMNCEDALEMLQYFQFIFFFAQSWPPPGKIPVSAGALNVLLDLQEKPNGKSVKYIGGGE